MLLNPYQRYKQNEFETATPGKLLLMLFDGAIRYLKQAKIGVESGNIESANKYLVKTQDIVFELIASLDYNQGKIAQTLNLIYDYLYQQLMQANIKKDVIIVEEVEKILIELRDTWEKAVIKNN